MNNKADIGLIGLAVMGENLVLNMASHDFTVAVYNRTTEKVDEFVNGRGAGKPIIGTHSVEELCSRLERPRRVVDGIPVPFAATWGRCKGGIPLAIFHS